MTASKQDFQRKLERALNSPRLAVALGRGVHPKIASEMLGHSTIAVTLDLYSHVTPSMTRGAADELDAVLVVAR